MVVLEVMVPVVEAAEVVFVLAGIMKLPVVVVLQKQVLQLQQVKLFQ